MIEDAPIVKDTRNIRSLISSRFGNDLDAYIAYLRTERLRRKPSSETQVRGEGSKFAPTR